MTDSCASHDCVWTVNLHPLPEWVHLTLVTWHHTEIKNEVKFTNIGVFYRILMFSIYYIYCHTSDNMMKRNA